MEKIIIFAYNALSKQSLKSEQTNVGSKIFEKLILD